MGMFKRGSKFGDDEKPPGNGDRAGKMNGGFDYLIEISALREDLTPKDQDPIWILEGVVEATDDPAFDKGDAIAWALVFKGNPKAKKNLSKTGLLRKVVAAITGKRWQDVSPDDLDDATSAANPHAGKLVRAQTKELPPKDGYETGLIVVEWSSVAS